MQLRIFAAISALFAALMFLSPAAAQGVPEGVDPLRWAGESPEGRLARLVSTATDADNCVTFRRTLDELESWARHWEDNRPALARKAQNALASFDEEYTRDCGPRPKADEYVRVADAYGAGFFYIPGTDTMLRISGSVRAESVGESYGIGVHQGSDTFISNPKWATGGGLSADYWFSFLDKQNRLSLETSWTEAEDTGTDPAGGATNGGYVPQDTADGAGWFTAGSDVRAATDISSATIELSHSIYGIFGDVLPAGGSSDYRAFGFSTYFRRSWQDYRGEVEVVGNPAFGAAVDQEFDSYGFGFGPSFICLNWLGEPGDGAYIRADGTVQAVLMQSDLRSVEDHTQAGVTTRNVIEEDRTSFGAKARGGLSFGYASKSGWYAEFGAGLSYGLDNVVDVRENPDDRSTHIDDEYVLDAEALITLGLKF